MSDPNQSQTTDPEFTYPPRADLLWLCTHPFHSLRMTEIEGLFVPIIVDENGNGPVIVAGWDQLSPKGLS